MTYSQTIYAVVSELLNISACIISRYICWAIQHNWRYTVLVWTMWSSLCIWWAWAVGIAKILRSGELILQYAEHLNSCGAANRKYSILLWYVSYMSEMIHPCFSGYMKLYAKAWLFYEGSPSTWSPAFDLRHIVLRSSCHVYAGYTRYWNCRGYNKSQAFISHTVRPLLNQLIQWTTVQSMMLIQ